MLVFCTIKILRNKDGYISWEWTFFLFHFTITYNRGPLHKERVRFYEKNFLPEEQGPLGKVFITGSNRKSQKLSLFGTAPITPVTSRQPTRPTTINAVETNRLEEGAKTHLGTICHGSSWSVASCSQTGINSQWCLSISVAPAVLCRADCLRVTGVLIYTPRNIKQKQANKSPRLFRNHAFFKQVGIPPPT